MEYHPSPNLKELQKVDIEMLRDIVEIFDKHNLQYFLIAGSLLGAVRHNGFIPWDDDLDIGLPRPDYEIFIKYKDEWLQGQYYAENFESSSDYKYYITRVYNKKVRVKELRGKEEKKTFASIDIFPIDGTPNNKILRYFFIKKIMFYRMLASLSNYSNIDQHRKRGLGEKIFISAMGILNTEFWLKQENIYRHIDKLLKGQKYSDSDFVGSLMGAYREKEIFERAFIGDRAKYLFSDLNVYGPQDYNGYLTHMYGDYMKTPTLEQIKEKQHFEIMVEKK